MLMEPVTGSSRVARFYHPLERMRSDWNSDLLSKRFFYLLQQLQGAVGTAPPSLLSSIRSGRCTPRILSMPLTFLYLETCFPHVF